jgi:hypothetical protein
MGRDPELIALVEAHAGPFPSGLAGEEINGVDLVLLDAAISGIASHYSRNSRPVTAEHRAQLHALLDDWDDVWPDLQTDEARDYFGRLRAVAEYLIQNRSPSDSPSV